MGTPAIASLSSAFAPARFPEPNFPGSGTAAHALLPQPPAPQQDVVALVQPNQAPAPDEVYGGAVYRSLETRQALSLQYSTLSGRLGQDSENGGAVGFQATQLTFDFFEESRYEEFALFNQRTNAAGDNVDPAQRASFFGTREEITTRFQLSISISGAALSGFANTAEGAGDSNALLEKLLEVTEKLLGGADELFSDFFSLLDGGDGEFNAASLEELFNEFISGVHDTLSEEFPDLLPALGLPAQGNGAGQQPNVQAAGVQLEFSFEFSASYSRQEVVVEQGDPIVLDLDGDGIELSNYQQGARFDLTGSGLAQQVAFVRGGDAFLALDRNGDGQINSGLELFGEQHGARNGFEELRRFDDNKDGLIDRRDSVFNDLQLFRDNGNGQTEAGELFRLIDAGISAIDLGYREIDERAAGGNRIAQIASFLRDDGSRGTAADALLNYIA